MCVCLCEVLCLLCASMPKVSLNVSDASSSTSYRVYFFHLCDTNTPTTTIRFHSERKTLKNFGFGCSLFVVHILCTCTGTQILLQQMTIIGENIVRNDAAWGWDEKSEGTLWVKDSRFVCSPQAYCTSYDPLRASYKLLFEFMSSCTNCCDYLTFFHSNKNLSFQCVDSTIVCCWRRERYDVYYVCNIMFAWILRWEVCGDDIYEAGACQALVLHIRLYVYIMWIERDAPVGRVE